MTMRACDIAINVFAGSARARAPHGPTGVDDDGPEPGLPLAGTDGIEADGSPGAHGVDREVPLCRYAVYQASVKTQGHNGITALRHYGTSEIDPQA
jgi:hypothetical protein